LVGAPTFSYTSGLTPPKKDAAKLNGICSSGFTPPPSVSQAKL